MARDREIKSMSSIVTETDRQLETKVDRQTEAKTERNELAR